MILLDGMLAVCGTRIPPLYAAGAMGDGKEVSATSGNPKARRPGYV